MRTAGSACQGPSASASAALQDQRSSLRGFERSCLGDLESAAGGSSSEAGLKLVAGSLRRDSSVEPCNASAVRCMAGFDMLLAHYDQLGWDSHLDQACRY